LRKLLVFGTGAAIIGMILLVTAFYETYLIVVSLESQITSGAASTSTNILETSSLEAIFLGIMALLGYVLIGQGLDGLKKQELVDVEGNIGRLSAPQQRSRLGSTKVQGDRPAGWRTALSAKGQQWQDASATVQGQPAAPQPSSELQPAAPETRRTFLFGSHDQVASIPESSAEKPASLSEPETTREEVVAVALEPVSPPVIDLPLNPTLQQPPVAPAIQEPERHEGPTPTISPAQAPPAQPEQVPPTGTATPETPNTEGPTFSTDVTPAPKATGTAGVTWEGGAPPPLEGVELMPELADYGATTPPTYNAPRTGHALGSVEPDRLQEGTGVQEIPVKRGRGRPKGTRKKTPEQSQTPEQTGTPEQSQTPESQS
jgi:hypothetical protein